MNNPSVTLASLMTEKFIAADPSAAAKALAALATHEVLLLIGGLKAEVIVACLNAMETPKAAAVLRRLPMRQASYVLSRLDVPKAADMMKEFSPAYREKMTAGLKPAFADLLQEAASYPQGSAGRVMSTDFVSVKTDAKVGDLVDRLKTMPRKKLPEACFVTAKDGALKGGIRTAELVFFQKDASAGSVMTADLPRLLPKDPVAKARELLAEGDWRLVPVTDENGRLVGVLSVFLLESAGPEEKSLWRKLMD